MTGAAQAEDGAAGGRKAKLRPAKAPFTGDRLFARLLGAPYHQVVNHPVDGLDAGDRAGSPRGSSGAA